MARVDVKVCLLGSSGVGKTCLLDRYVNGQFEPMPKNTIGAAFAAKRVKVKSENTITLGVWDTAGAEQFESLSKMYYHGSRAAAVCFDPCNRASFDKLQFWVKQLQDNEPQCAIYIVATKADQLAEGKRRAVPEAAIQKFAAAINASVHSTSAKSGDGVLDLFQGIAEALAVTLTQPSTPRPPGLSPILARPTGDGVGPRSHSIMLSPDASPPSRTTTQPSTCC